MNKHKLYLHIQGIRQKIKKKGRIVKELEKQYVKVRIESLDITGISKYQGLVVSKAFSLNGG